MPADLEDCLVQRFHRSQLSSGESVFSTAYRREVERESSWGLVQYSDGEGTYAAEIQHYVLVSAKPGATVSSTSGSGVKRIAICNLYGNCHRGAADRAAGRAGLEEDGTFAGSYWLARKPARSNQGPVPLPVFDNYPVMLSLL